jgi:hypothetical protein
MSWNVLLQDYTRQTNMSVFNCDNTIDHNLTGVKDDSKCLAEH